MSSVAVRRKVRAWAKLLPNCTYVEAINVEEEISGIDVALTADFVGERIERQTYCGDEVESGTITLSWIGRPGVGDEDLLTIAEAGAAVFYANTDPQLTLISRGIPDTFDTSGSTPRFIIDITFEYEYRP